MPATHRFRESPPAACGPSWNPPWKRFKQERPKLSSLPAQPPASSRNCWREMPSALVWLLLRGGAPCVVPSRVLEDLEPLARSKQALTIRKATHARHPRATSIDQLLRRRRASCCLEPSLKSRKTSVISPLYTAGSQLLGCGALHFYTPTSGEIRSLAVAPEARKQGVGVFLIDGS